MILLFVCLSVCLFERREPKALFCCLIVCLFDCLFNLLFVCLGDEAKPSEKGEECDDGIMFKEQKTSKQANKT